MLLLPINVQDFHPRHVPHAHPRAPELLPHVGHQVLRVGVEKVARDIHRVPSLVHLLRALHGVLGDPDRESFRGAAILPGQAALVWPFLAPHFGLNLLLHVAPGVAYPGVDGVEGGCVVVVRRRYPEVPKRPVQLALQPLRRPEKRPEHGREGVSPGDGVRLIVPDPQPLLQPLVDPQHLVPQYLVLGVLPVHRPVQRQVDVFLPKVFPLHVLHEPVEQALPFPHGPVAVYVGLSRVGEQPLIPQVCRSLAPWQRPVDNVGHEVMPHWSRYAPVHHEHPPGLVSEVQVPPQSAQAVVETAALVGTRLDEEARGVGIGEYLVAGVLFSHGYVPVEVVCEPLGEDGPVHSSRYLAGFVPGDSEVGRVVVGVILEQRRRHAPGLGDNVVEVACEDGGGRYSSESSEVPAWSQCWRLRHDDIAGLLAAY
mmetsp:Transcript_53225/g.113086  ORF Transcript_53225/g.113086 Transcript_53225/m.113086 type:complete len:425 (-) Transcript_53225:73-1347(-)